jgi:hypothetical protein
MQRMAAALCGLAASVVVSAVAAASPIIFDRGLPTANLNHAAGANRSNVAWADAGSTMSIGDNFSLAYWSVIDTVRVWVVTRDANLPAANAYTLLLGNDLGNSTVVSPAASSTSVSIATYSGGATYQATNGDMITIFQVDFAGLNLVVGPGTLAFGITGPARSDLNTPFVHASNGPLSGSTQTGSDGVIYGFDSFGAMDIGNGWPWMSSISGWDKNSDINIQVFGSVPEPGTLVLLAFALLGVAGFALMRRPVTV